MFSCPLKKNEVIRYAVRNCDVLSTNVKQYEEILNRDGRRKTDVWTGELRPANVPDKITRYMIEFTPLEETIIRSIRLRGLELQLTLSIAQCARFALEQCNPKLMTRDGLQAIKKERKRRTNAPRKS